LESGHQLAGPSRLELLVAQARDRQRDEESDRRRDVAREEDERRRHREHATRNERRRRDEHEHMVAQWIQKCAEARHDVPPTRKPTVEEIRQARDADQARARQRAVGSEESRREKNPRQRQQHRDVADSRKCAHVQILARG
jgi:hypothetical protein